MTEDLELYAYSCKERTAEVFVNLIKYKFPDIGEVEVTPTKTGYTISLQNPEQNKEVTDYINNILNSLP